jgi:hypothetical protein
MNVPKCKQHGIFTSIKFLNAIFLLIGETEKVAKQ